MFAVSGYTTISTDCTCDSAPCRLNFDATKICHVVLLFQKREALIDENQILLDEKQDVTTDRRNWRDEKEGGEKDRGKPSAHGISEEAEAEVGLNGQASANQRWVTVRDASPLPFVAKPGHGGQVQREVRRRLGKQTF